MDTVLQNLRYAFRRLIKSPGFTTVAVLTLALGIGGNAAIFSLFEQMLLRALPVQQPEQLVNLSAPGPKPGMQSCNQAGDCDAVFSYPMFRDLQEQAPSGFAGIAAHRSYSANLAYGNQTLTGDLMLVSGSYFPVLGVRPALGRLLGPADDQTIGAHPVAVLSYGFWQSSLGADPGVLDQTIIVNGQPMTIVGVAPRGFEGTTLGTQPQVFVPITMSGALVPGFGEFDGYNNRRSYWTYLFARLMPGTSMERAGTAINAVYGPILSDVESPLQEGMSESTMSRFVEKEITLEAGQKGQSSLDRDVRTPLILLFGVTGIVLLIACANIANLLLARGTSRSMEMAVRLSLGANRRQVMTQLLTESCLLAALGGIASLYVAWATLAGIASILPPEAAATLQLELRPAVVVFAAALSIGTGLIFGMFPALHSTRPDLVTTIRANAGAISGVRSAARFRMSLVTLQIGLSVLLLIAAGLSLRSLLNVSRVDLGLRAENVVTFGVSPELNGFEPARSMALFQRIEEDLGAIPGVTGVTSSLVPILSGSNWGNDVSVEGFESGPGIDSNSRFNAVGPGYFHTMGIPLLAGREFTPSDDAEAPKVAIVNEAFAEKFELGRDAVGRWMAIGGTDSLDIRIVGVVQDAKYSEVKDEVPPLYFTPYRQQENIGALTFYVRTASDPRPLLQTTRTVVSRLEPNLPIENLKTLPMQVRENIFLDRMVSTLSAAFAVLATLLAAIGLYGVMAYSVAQRTREIGIRMALGAHRHDVMRLVLRQGVAPLLIGGVLGLAAAFAATRLISSILYGVSATDATTFVAVPLVLALVTLLASYLPARRATRVDPMIALRAE